MNWINLFGLVIIVVMMIPNMIYAGKEKEKLPDCRNGVINILEQAGRIACIFFMIVNIGSEDPGFYSTAAFVIYAAGNALLITLYLIFWIPYFKKRTLVNGMLLAVIPVCIFLLSGVTLRNGLLVLSGIVFAAGHVGNIYLTHKALDQ